MPITKRASASGEHAKDAKDPDSIDEKAIHETGPVNEMRVVWIRYPTGRQVTLGTAAGWQDAAEGA